MENIYHENEVKTNRIAGRALFALTVLMILYSVLGIFNIIDMGGLCCSCLLLIITASMLLLHLIASHLHLESFQVRHAIIAESLILCGASYFLYPTRELFLFFGPIIMSIMYSDEKFILKVSFASWLVFVITLYANLLLVYYFPWMRNFRLEQGLVSITSPIAVFQQLFLPRSTVFLITAYVSKTITQNEKKMLNEQIEITTAAAKSSSELDAAARIQMLSMPDTAFVSQDGSMQLSAFLQPAKIVGGDFFDHFMITDNLMAMLVADVSDKGLPSAMFAMRAQSILRFALTSEAGHSDDPSVNGIDLEKAVNLTNERLSGNNSENFFVTLCLCCVDLRTGMGKFVNAGHLPPLIRHADGSTQLLECEPQLFLGFSDLGELRSGIFSLREGDSIVLYTDGVTDAVNASGTMFGFDEFVHTVSKTSSCVAQDITRAVSDAVLHYIGNCDRFDDITILTASYTGKPAYTEKRFSVSAEDCETALSAINDMLCAVRCPEDTRRSMDSVIDDVFTNIEDYAYDGNGGEVGIFCRFGANFVQMEFSDKGPAFDPTQATAPDTNGDPSIGGLGIFLIRSLTDAMSYRRENDTNILTLTKIWNI